MPRYRFLLIFLFMMMAAVLGGVSSGWAQSSAPSAAHEATASPWTVRCNATQEANGHCEMFQRLVVKDSGQRVAELAIGFVPGEEAGRGALVLPLGILLTESMGLVIDNDKIFSFKVRYCAIEGCFAFIRADKTLLKAMEKGREAVIKAQTLTGQALHITFTLDGFSKALKEITL